MANSSGSGDDLIDAAVGDLAQRRLAAHLDARDARRYRALRNVPLQRLGNAGVPCIALPNHSGGGDYINGADADHEVDAMLCAQSGSKPEQGRG